MVHRGDSSRFRTSQGGEFTGGEVAEATPAQTTVRYQVEGKTCASRRGHAREAIAATPGVALMAVSYRDGGAEVVWSDKPSDAAVADAVAEFADQAGSLR